MIKGVVKLKPGKEASVLRKHPWIFSGAIDKIDNNIHENDWVKVIDHNNKTLGIGYYTNKSIAVKIIHFGNENDENICIELNILNAINFRKSYFSDLNYTNAYRLIFAESDNMPGLIADYYNGTVVLQSQTTAIHNKINFIADIIASNVPNVNCIYEKSSAKLHDNSTDKIIKGNNISKTIKENGLDFIVDIPNGQKTGFFLDQRDNRLAVKEFAKNRTVLNAFAYTGGFSVYALAGGAQKVDSVDISENAINIADENIALNHFQNKHKSFCSDVFDFLETCNPEYDMIILDPPAFAKKSNVTNNALRAYKMLNLMAMQKIIKEGLLFTFSCSQLINLDMFSSAIRSAAIDSKRNVSIIKTFSQPIDHPISIFVPETNYLKGLLLKID